MPLVLATWGYHPLANDGGLYAAGVLRLIHPRLYPLNSAFVLPYTRWTVLPWLLAGMVKLTHLPLGWVLFAAWLVSTAAFLAGCQAVAARLFASPAAQVCAVVLAAACFSMPAAGTALFVMDPYVTARSFSTPLGLFAVAACLDRAWLRTAALVALTVMVHPLMGALVAAYVLLQGLVAAGRLGMALRLCAAACAAFGGAFVVAHSLPPQPAYAQLSVLRPFLFLSRWRWFEDAGLLLPLLLLGIGVWQLGSSTRKGSVCLACILLGGSSVLVAALFVPASGPYLLTPLQVLRSFHLIYVLGLLLLGGWLSTLRRRSRFIPAATLALLFVLMFGVQRAAWASSGWIEWPGTPPVNPWAQAFLWIRGHTPADAVFAFNPRLVLLPGEEEQNFRAISQRDQLADDKDAGAASVVPRLAPQALRQIQADAGIDAMTDAERLASLRPLGATWVLLAPRAATHLPCPYRNQVTQVCRLSE